MENEKPKNEYKPKNEEVRAALVAWRMAAIGFALAVVVIGSLSAYLLSHQPSPTEAVKYCGDYPCQVVTPMPTPAHDIALNMGEFGDFFGEMFRCTAPLLIFPVILALTTTIARGLVVLLLKAFK